MTLRNDLALLSRSLRAGGASRPDFPWRLTLVATERCNLRCDHCRIWEGGGEAGMTLPALDEIFSRAGAGLSWVDVTGGEIFLREDAGEILGTVASRCPRLSVLHFPTNGWFADRVAETVRAFLRRPSPPRLLVTVSVDGPPAVHDAVRGAEGSFDRAVECFARLREIPGCTPFLGTTLGAANLGRTGETLAAVARRVPRLSPDELHVNLPHASSHYYRNADGERPPPEAVAAEVRAFLRLRGVPASIPALAERRLLALALPYLRTGRTPVPCAALAAACFVGADGTVYPCVTWDRPLGRLADFGHDLGALWRSPAAAEARREVAAGRCPQCWTACEAIPSLAACWGGLRR